MKKKIVKTLAFKREHISDLTEEEQRYMLGGDVMATAVYCGTATQITACGQCPVTNECSIAGCPPATVRCTVECTVVGCTSPYTNGPTLAACH
ncbi:hypothetical protein ACTJJB_07750 [Chitinophaga sp. 22536]|uniref:hypothetical protein n=1 Tax=unclassified Chitinophaga TaxID=2619133 RepID=UPI003F8764A2